MITGSPGKANRVPPATWKDVERRVCRALRLQRNPGSGSNGGMGSCGDCAAPEVGRPRGWLYVEIKHRANGFTLWHDTQKKAKAERRTPILVQHEKGTQNYLVTVPLPLFAALLDAADANGTHVTVIAPEKIGDANNGA